MEAKILYISKSGKSALVSVNQRLGDITQSVTGFVRLPENSDRSVGDSLNIPASKVAVELSKTEDGQEFKQLVFS